MNYLLEKILLWFHWKNENAFSPNIINAYHEDLIHQIKSQKGILFLHFLSFHGLGYSTEPQLRKDVIYADYWLKKAIHKINQLNPNAHIIVFSDHGERTAKGFDRKDAILYVR